MASSQWEDKFKLLDKFEDERLVNLVKIIYQEGLSSFA